MKNGRQNRDNRNASAAATTERSGESITNGGNVRTDDRSESSVNAGNRGNESGAVANNGDAERSIVRNSELTITDGFYFTPRGTVERIPDGHYIDGSGRLRKRRQQRSDNSNSADGNAHRNRSETSEQTEFTSENFLLEKPDSVRGKRGRKAKIKEETSKLTLVTMLATASVAVFSSIELITKHKHWALENAEAKILAEALNDTLATLPAKYYDSIVRIIEKWIPWVNLIFVIGAIVIPRIEESSKQLEQSKSSQSGNNAQNQGNDKRNEGTEDNPFSSWSSLGWSR
jgi:hypothetical protein